MSMVWNMVWNDNSTVLAVPNAELTKECMERCIKHISYLFKEKLYNE